LRETDKKEGEQFFVLFGGDTFHAVPAEKGEGERWQNRGESVNICYGRGQPRSNLKKKKPLKELKKKKEESIGREMHY